MIDTYENLTGNLQTNNSLKGSINMPVEKIEPTTEELEINPSFEEQNFEPNEGTYYKNVKCNAIDIQKTQLTVTPTDEEQIIEPNQENELFDRITVRAASGGSSDNYSLEEKVVGTWINNKPVYRKVFIGNNISDPTSFDTEIDNVEDLISLECMLKNNQDGGWRNLPWLFYTSMGMSYITNWLGGFYFLPSDRKIYFQVGTNLRNISKYILIMKYTKTTDVVE